MIDLLQEAEFAEVRLASFLRTPDGEIVQAVVGSVLPWPLSMEWELLVDAVMLAAEAQRRNDQRTAAVLAVVRVLPVVLVADFIASSE